jgi:hypothetical protein
MRYNRAMATQSRPSVFERIEAAIEAVVPPGTPVTVAESSEVALVDIGTTHLRVAWAGEGWMGDVKPLLDRSWEHVDVVAARRMSPGARAALIDAGLGWVDETGAAEVSLPGLVISRSGRSEPKLDTPPRWSPSVIGTAEALLLGTRPTVAEVERTTGLAAGTATNALAALTTLGLLTADAARGRGSARAVVDRRALLTAYADAAAAATRPLSIRVGILGDLVKGLAKLGRRWDADGVAWAATGPAAASVLAPYMTEVTGLDVFVDAPTLGTLDAIAEKSNLRPIEGGRLVLRPFPTPVTQRLSARADGLRVAPWPRVYADLRITGVRGEEAAEHLFEVVGSA